MRYSRPGNGLSRRISRCQATGSISLKGLRWASFSRAAAMASPRERMRGWVTVTLTSMLSGKLGGGSSQMSCEPWRMAR